MRVVVAEDVMLTREGITRLLTDACVDVVGEAGDAASLLREVRMTRPDAAVVDIRMPPTPTKASSPRSRSAPSIPISGCSSPGGDRRAEQRNRERDHEQQRGAGRRS
jgi:DNA-binding NarL/FixJ family response regulator